MTEKKIKICGLTTAEDIDAVNLYLPDYIGFVFAPSKRQVKPDAAAHLKKRLDPGIKAIGVFVNAPLPEILSLAENRVIDGIQLHGDEDADYAEALRRQLHKIRLRLPILRAIRVKSEDDILPAAAYPADALLLDTYVKGSYGGSGTRFNWSLIPPLKTPYVLAGGIDETNLKEALNTGAFCIDVSSGAETNGKKDPVKIKNIIQIVRSTRLCQKENSDSMGDSLFPKR